MHAVRKITNVLQSAFLYLVLAMFAVFFLFPLVWMLLSSFKDGPSIATAPMSFVFNEFNLKNYRSLLTSVPLWIGFKNTSIVLLFKGALGMVFAPLAGFAFAKFNFRFKNALFLIVLGSIMLPPIVMLVPLLIEMGKLGWIDTYLALFLPGAISGFSIFLMRQQIAEVPDEILDAGRIDGCSSTGLFWWLVLPMIKPSLAALAILTLLDIYNDFVWPVIAVNSMKMQTLQVMLSDLYNQINNMQVGVQGANAWGQVLAASTLAMIPLLTLFIILQKHFIRGLLSGGLKG